MKKYACMLIALSAISVFSFTQTFDRSVVLAVGGLDKCNGSDISDPIQCPQLQGSQATCHPTAKYSKVEDTQAYKDVISEETTACQGSGCENIEKNPSPRGDETCEKHTVLILDPVEVLAP